MELSTLNWEPLLNTSDSWIPKSLASSLDLDSRSSLVRMAAWTCSLPT